MANNTLIVVGLLAGAYFLQKGGAPSGSGGGGGGGPRSQTLLPSTSLEERLADFDNEEISFAGAGFAAAENITPTAVQTLDEDIGKKPAIRNVYNVYFPPGVGVTTSAVPIEGGDPVLLNPELVEAGEAKIVSLAGLDEVLAAATTIDEPDESYGSVEESFEATGPPPIDESYGSFEELFEATGPPPIDESYGSFEELFEATGPPPIDESYGSFEELFEGPGSFVAADAPAIDESFGSFEQSFEEVALEEPGVITGFEEF
jgi:hypothetical protein